MSNFYRWTFVTEGEREQVIAVVRDCYNPDGFPKDRHVAIAAHVEQVHGIEVLGARYQSGIAEHHAAIILGGNDLLSVLTAVGELGILP